MTYKYVNAFPVAALGASNNTLYTVPTAASVSLIRSAKVHNPTTGVIQFQVNIVAPAGSVASTNQIIERNIAVNETYMCPELLNMSLVAGTVVSATGQNLNVELSVAEVVQ